MCSKLGKGKGKGTDRSLEKRVLRSLILRGESGGYIVVLSRGRADKSGSRAES